MEAREVGDGESGRGKCVQLLSALLPKTADGRILVNWIQRKTHDARCSVSTAPRRSVHYMAMEVLLLAIT